MVFTFNHIKNNYLSNSFLNITFYIDLFKQYELCLKRKCFLLTQFFEINLIILVSYFGCHWCDLVVHDEKICIRPLVSYVKKHLILGNFFH